MSLTFHSALRKLNTEPSEGASHQVSEIFRNRPTRNKNCLWWPCLLTNRDKMSSFYRGPSKDASHQISVHLAKQFQKRFLRNQPIRNKNSLWWPCLLMNRDEIGNLYRGVSIDASYQVWFHLAKRFQRRRLKYEKLTDNGRWMPSDGNSSYCLWQGEIKTIFAL